MKKIVIIIALAFIAAIGARSVSAAGTADITFPVQELGGCVDKDACKTYCDNEANRAACVDFGKTHGLVSESEASQIKNLPPSGPGGCVGNDACRAYCSDSEHSEECIKFGEEHGLISKEDAKRGREFANQTGPGGCKGAQECRAYCSNQTHQEECIKFSEDHGFISHEQAAKAKIFGGGGGPGGCKGPDDCKQYCEDPAHQDECIRFGEEHNLISHEEATKAREIAGKTGPGDCRGADGCRKYCSDTAHQEECLKFAEENNLVPKEHLEQARRFLKVAQEGGPGNCKGQEECRKYCSDSARQEECFKFAKGKGLTRPEDEESFEVGQKLNETVKTSGGPGGCKSDDECRSYCSDQAHVEECFAFASAHGGVSEEKAKALLQRFTENKFGPDNEDFQAEAEKKYETFRKLEEQYRGLRGEFAPRADGAGSFTGDRPFPAMPSETGENTASAPHQGFKTFSGPGGCSGPSECIKYCSEHQDECASFGGPGKPDVKPGEGGVPPGKFMREEMRIKPIDQPEFHDSRNSSNMFEEMKQRYEKQRQEQTHPDKQPQSYNQDYQKPREDSYQGEQKYPQNAEPQTYQQPPQGGTTQP